jgi:hypothetical protein
MPVTKFGIAFWDRSGGPYLAGALPRLREGG